MCGIAGYIDKPISGKLEKMNEKMFHRGPDDDGFFEDSSFHLCMRRLSIVDLESGKQPIFNSDKTVVVMLNGEIYNYIELTCDLKKKGYIFSTKSDTEVIAHLYDEYGIDFIDKLNGMFTICLLDTKTNDLYLIRDRFGEKPIYYHYDKEKKEFEFASEFNVIKFNHPDKSININSLIWYFSQKSMPFDKTIAPSIEKVPPGSYLHLKADKSLEITKYYKIPSKNILAHSDENEIIEKLENLIVDSIKLRMRADVEVGAFLSGGLDSSLITAIASKLTNKPIKTYALVYNQEINNKSEDKKYAKHASEIFSTKHTEVLLTPEILISELPKIVTQFGQPNSAVISSWFISRQMCQDVKVALSGDGADELFGSYFLHRIAGVLVDYNNTKDKKLLKVSSEIESTFLENNLDKPFSHLIDQFAVFSDEELQKLLKPQFYKRGLILKMFEKREKELLASDLLNKMLEYDFNSLLVEQILNYTDTLGMAHSLEIRVPYLDYRIVELVFSLNHKYKIKNGITKYILKKVGEKYLPKDLVYREKEGFVEPAVYWLQNELKDFCLYYLKSKDFDKFNLLNKSYVNHIIDSFYATNDFFLGKKVWNLLMYGLWEGQYANQ